MIPFRKSIGFRLLGVSFILLALPLLIDSFILIQKRYEHAIAEAKGALLEIAHHREIPLSRIRPVNKPLTTLILKFLNLEVQFPEKPNADLNRKLDGIADIGQFWGVLIFRLTAEGKAIVVGGNLESEIGNDYTNFFKLNNLFSTEGLEKGFSTYISYDTKTLEPYFVISRLIYSPEGKVIGILGIFDDIANKIKDLLTPLTRDYRVNFALVLNSGIIFAATDPKFRLQYFHPLDPEYEKIFREEYPFAATFLPREPLKIKDQSSYPYIEFVWDGEDQLGYIQQISGADYALLTYASKNEIFQSPIHTFFQLYSGYVAILLIGGLVAWLVTVRMARPIQNLSKVMLEMQKGNLNIRYQDDPLGFEINTLGAIFNETVDTLLSHTQRAEEERIEKELVVQELRLGQQVQLSLLPQKMPTYPGVELAEKYIPAIEVGGDFYDVFVKQKEERKQLVLAIADASGKGVRACLFSLNVKNMLRTYAKEYDDVAQAMNATNSLFLLDTLDSGMFVTAFMCVYDHESGLLQYHSCGHNPPLVRKNNGTIEILTQHGPALGINHRGSEKAAMTRLEKGDLLVLYTDGVTEAHDEHFHLFGEERLIKFLEKEGSKSPVAFIDALVNEVTRFCGNTPQHDDITLLVMKVL